MKARSLGLMLLLLAGSASGALAQERGGRGRFEPTPRSLPAAPAARQAPSAVQAPSAPRTRPGWEGRAPRSWDDGGRRRGERRDRPSWEGLRPDANAGGGERRGSDGRAWDRDRGRPDLRGLESSRSRPPEARTPPPAPSDAGPRVIHRSERPERPDRYRRGAERPRGDRWDRNDRGGSDLRWNDGRYTRRPDRAPTWQPRRYPPVYTSRARHRGHLWIVPPGYYRHSWSYGEYLPRAWYAPDYYVLEWWLYDLPEPPVGYQWIRVDADAVLVDVYTGEVVQVVRLAFW